MGFLATIAPAEQYIYRTKINKQSETPSEFYIYCIGIFILFKRVCDVWHRESPSKKGARGCKLVLVKTGIAQKNTTPSIPLF